jgi:hypothetical protein
VLLARAAALARWRGVAPLAKVART